MANESDQQQQSQQNTKINDMDKTLDNSFKINNTKSCDDLDCSKESESDDHSEYSTASKGKLNDLVADLCLNGHRSAGQNPQILPNQASFGDYTNIRATSGPVGISEGNFSAQTSVDGTNSTNSTTMASTHNVQQQPPTHNSSFSFKHFLSSSSVPTAPSTTVTSLDPPASNTSTTSSNATTSCRSLQTSTGARPKVPQSSSVSSTSISSLTVGGASDSQTSATKMKRSPRFSSFDSQASLAEYAGTSIKPDVPPGENSGGFSNGSNSFRLYPDEKERDHFQEWNLPSNASTMTTNSTDYDRDNSYVPRSYSNYDVHRPQTSPRRRVGIGATAKDTRPTRLALYTNQNPTTAAKLKLDLPLTSNSIGCGGSNVVNAAGAAGSSRKTGLCSRPTDFPTVNPLPGAAAAAAALPDFVQDHWMDSWYANDMHVNSPPSSPINSFMEDLTGGGAGAAGISNAIGQAGSGHIHNSANQGLHLDNAPILGPTDRGDFNMGLPEPPSSSVGSKMLPDFLSDGPIIHSSQRLADVAAGLPSNSIGSPEESSINNQLSRLRSENEHLQRDLNETRLALNEQTVRANNLERQLAEQQRQLKTEAEEILDKNKKRATAAQVHVAKLKQQVQQLTSELQMLKREKESMHEEGAVGGYNIQSRERSYAAAAISATTRSSSVSAAVTTSNINTVAGSKSSGSIGSGTDLGIRPSRQHQLSRDLRRAASNAEQNLKQLLTGVENLRQMAANIEKSETRIDYDDSPDLFSDFLDECDEYPGNGPAL